MENYIDRMLFFVVDQIHRNRSRAMYIYNNKILCSRNLIERLLLYLNISKNFIGIFPLYIVCTASIQKLGHPA